MRCWSRSRTATQVRATPPHVLVPAPAPTRPRLQRALPPRRAPVPTKTFPCGQPRAYTTTTCTAAATGGWRRKEEVAVGRLIKDLESRDPAVLERVTASVLFLTGQPKLAQQLKDGGKRPRVACGVHCGCGARGREALVHVAACTIASFGMPHNGCIVRSVCLTMSPLRSGRVCNHRGL